MPDAHAAAWKPSRSGSGWRPALPGGAERNSSTSRNAAPGIWPSRKSSSPRAGFSMSQRQSTNRYCTTRACTKSIAGSTIPSEMSVGIGSEFAGYRLEDEVGRGGMGVVYRATELGLDRPVALKLIAPELAGDAAFRERFLRESRLAGAVGQHGI